MASPRWDHVQVDFGNDETGNFGPREEFGSALFQVNTVGTISPEGEVTHNPSVISTAVKDFTAVAVEKQVSLFNDACRTFLVTLTFDSDIDAIAFSDDCLFLLIGERNGILHFVNVGSESVFFSQKLGHENRGKDKPYFSELVFSSFTEKGVCDVYILTSTARLFMLEGFRSENLHNALMAHDLPTAKKIQDSMKMREVDVSGYHSHQANCIAIPHECYSQYFIIGGQGDSSLTQWEKDNDGLSPVMDFCEDAMEDPGIIQCQISNDGFYVFTLDSEKLLSVWDVESGLCIKYWSDALFQDFMLLENGQKSESFLDMEIVGLTLPEDGDCFLEVREVATFKVLYSLKLSEHTTLTHGPPYQENIFVVEGASGENNNLVTTLRIREISEAQPEARLHRLLHKENFEEAESFAKLFNLDIELVYKSKACHLINKLSLSNVDLHDQVKQENGAGVSSENEDTLIKQLHDCLENIKDDGFITDQCIAATLPSLDSTMDLLLYAKSRLNVSSTAVAVRNALKAKLARTINKLQTFELAYKKQSYSAQKWDSFKNSNLLWEILSLIGQDKLSAALTIWQRHQGEFEDDIGLAVIEDVLYSINEERKTSEIQPWLEQTFIPFIIRVSPCKLHVIAAWMEERTRRMESTEKAGWPQNALSFAQILLKVCHKLQEESFSSGFHVPADIVSQVEHSDVEEYKKLRTLIGQLQKVNELLTVYGLALSLPEFLRETTESIVFRMLDRVHVEDRIPAAIQNTVEPYMKQHNLRRDKILLQYIQDLMLSTDNFHMLSVTEGRAITVISCINCMEYKCEAIRKVMSKAFTPWSEAVKDMVEKGLAMEHSKAEAIREHYHVVQLKEMLSSYGIRDTRENFSQEKLLYYILKHDRPSAVEDALEVVKVFDNVTEEMVYMFRIRFLVKNNRLSECYHLLRSLPSDIAIRCGVKMVINTVVLLKDDCWFDPEGNKREKILQTKASIRICDLILPLLKEGDYWHDEIKSCCEDLKAICALQAEYGEFLSREDYSCQKKREELLYSHIAAFFSGKETKMSPVQDEDKKTGTKKAKNFSTIYRLADLLCIPRDLIPGRLAIQAARDGNEQAAIKFCRELLEEPVSAPTAKVLYEVGTALHSLLSSKDLKGSMDELPTVVHDMAKMAVTFCEPDMIVDCLELSKCTSRSARVCMSLGSGDYGSSVKDHKESLDGFSVDPYKEWSFSPIYKEDGLFMESSKAIPLISRYSRVCLPSIGLDRHPYVQDRLPGTAHLGKQESGVSDTDESVKFMENTESVALDCVQYFRENSRDCLALEMAIDYAQELMQYVIIQDMGYPNTPAKSDLLKSEKQALMKIVGTSSKTIRNLLLAIIMKLLNHHFIDIDFALNVLCTMSKKDVYSLLKSIIASVGLNYKRLTGIADLGINYSILTGEHKALSTLQDLKKKATWGHKLGKLKVSFKRAFEGGNEEKWEIIKQLADIDVNVSLVLEFCSDFKMDENKALVLYLQHLMITKATVEDKADLAWQRKANQVIEYLGGSEVLADSLKHILNKLDPYDYTKLAFVLTVLEEKFSDTSIDKYKKVLTSLLHYKRVSKPSEYELTYGEEAVTEEQLMYEGPKRLSPLSQERLPLHPLIHGKPWRIITPELNTKTVTFWLRLTKLLKLSTDDMYTTTIQNAVRQHISDLRTRHNYSDEADKSKCNWNNEDVDAEFYEEVRSILLKISNAELGAACAVWIIKELPMGAEKVFALKAYLTLTEMWSCASAAGSSEKEKATAAYNKYSKIYKRLATEQILYQNNMATDEFLHLATSPAKLIFQLYEHPSIVERCSDPFGIYPDIHKISDEVATINSVGVSKIRMTLVEKWLMSASDGKQEDADTTMTFNFQLNAPLMEDDSVTAWADDNLKRVIYLLQNLPSESKLEQLMVFASFMPGSQQPDSPEGKLRALHCAFALADAEKVAMMAQVSLSELRLMIRNLKYLVDLKALRIQHTMQEFEECDKEKLVDRIWKKHSREGRALKLMCRLCLDFKVYQIKQWNGIVKQLLSFNMVSTLRTVLPVLADVGVLLDFGSLLQAWNTIILAPFMEASPPLNESQVRSCIESLSLLTKYPSILRELDLGKISQHYMNVDLTPCALFCYILTDPRGKGEHNTQNFLKNIELCDLLDQTVKLQKSGLHPSVVDDIKEVVFMYLQEANDYVTLQKSAHFLDYLNHLIGQDDIDTLLTASIASDRLKEAERLVVMYNSHYGLTMQESPQDQLKFYLRDKGMFNTLREKFEDDNAV